MVYLELHGAQPFVDAFFFFSAYMPSQSIGDDDDHSTLVVK